MAGILKMDGTPVIPVDCDGVFTSDIAVQARIEMPGLEFRYRTLCEKRILRPGQPIIVETDTRHAVLFPYRNHWTDPADIAAVKRGFRIMSFWVSDMWGHNGKILVPPIGVGDSALGGLNESEVKDLFDLLLGSNPNFVWVER